MSFNIHVGECLEVLKTLEANSIDAMVTDPPAGVAFMGKAWDGDKGGRRQWVAWLAEIMGEALRVLKPGGHAVVWSLPRTSHWTGWALEDAGFEVRDCGQLFHAFGSGFPKSHNVSIAIDKRRDDTGEVRGVCRFLRGAMEASGTSASDIAARFGFHSRMVDHWAARDTDSQPTCPTWDQWLMLKTFVGLSDDMDAEVWRLNGRKGKPGEAWSEREFVGEHQGMPGGFGEHRFSAVNRDITAPATPEAAKWEGFGSALKPAYEGWWLVRKPLDGTIAANVLKWGVGALNIDGCRVDGRDRPLIEKVKGDNTNGTNTYGAGLSPCSRFSGTTSLGRWPPNVLLMHADGCTDARCVQGCAAQAIREQGGDPEFFPCFYQAKPSREEREAGLEALPLRSAKKWNEGGLQGRRDEQAAQAIAEAEVHSQGLDARGRTLIREDGTKTLVDRFIPQHRANVHPTVKPITLMRWLARLVTPPGGTVLDPFTGSGTTGCACPYEGFRFVGIERELEYAEIARARIAWHEIAASRAIDPREEVIDGKPAQLSLFGQQ